MNLWSYLKWEGFGEEKNSANLRSAIAGYRKIMARSKSGQPSDRDLLVKAIQTGN